jgi:hypothetical protein
MPAAPVAPNLTSWCRALAPWWRRWSFLCRSWSAAGARRSSCASSSMASEIPEARAEAVLADWLAELGWLAQADLSQPASVVAAAPSPVRPKWPPPGRSQPGSAAGRARVLLALWERQCGVPGIWQQTLCELGVDSVQQLALLAALNERLPGAGAAYPADPQGPSIPQPALSALAGTPNGGCAMTVTIKHKAPLVQTRPAPVRRAANLGARLAACLAASPLAPAIHDAADQMSSGLRRAQSGSARLPPDCRGWRWGSGSVSISPRPRSGGQPAGLPAPRSHLRAP